MFFLIGFVFSFCLRKVYLKSNKNCYSFLLTTEHKKWRRNVIFVAREFAVVDRGKKNCKNFNFSQNLSTKIREKKEWKRNFFMHYSLSASPNTILFRFQWSVNSFRNKNLYFTANFAFLFLQKSFSFIEQLKFQKIDKKRAFSFTWFFVLSFRLSTLFIFSIPAYFIHKK